jgi:hypothetical protein
MKRDDIPTLQPIDTTKLHESIARCEAIAYAMYVNNREMGIPADNLRGVFSDVDALETRYRRERLPLEIWAVRDNLTGTIKNAHSERSRIWAPSGCRVVKLRVIDIEEQR